MRLPEIHPGVMCSKRGPGSFPADWSAWVLDEEQVEQARNRAAE